MKAIKTRIFATIVSAIFLIQLYLLHSRPWWGPESRFPMTLVRSIAMPAALGGTAILAILSAKSTVQRNLLYSIIIACAGQAVTVKLMLWLYQPALVMLILLLNAFIAFQFLRYGSIFAHEASTNQRGDASEPSQNKGCRERLRNCA
ncbi:MAG: hypothetical protein IVW54_19710 [Candidatus Binataceae bacterium]|nr:hypothetical protein [Candidatus Binataceae bacterium]